MVPQVDIQGIFQFCIYLCKSMALTFHHLIFTTITVGDFTFMFGYVLTGGLVVALITLRLAKKIVPLLQKGVFYFMYDALTNLFNFIVEYFYEPLKTSLSETGFIENILNFLENFIRCFFKLWNNDNNFTFTADGLLSVIIEVFCVLFIALIIKLAISIVNVFISTIKGVLK